MEKRSTISKKTLKIILGICIGVTILAVAGLFVYTYLADHNTLGRKISIWRVDVSGLDAKQAEEKIATEFADRPVSFQENDQEVYSTTLKELGYSLNEEALLSKLTEIQKQREESRKLFPKEENIEPECQIEEDEEQEKQALDLSNFGTEERKASVDAAIQYDKEKKEFTLVKQVQGTEIDPDKLDPGPGEIERPQHRTVFEGQLQTVGVRSVGVGDRYLDGLPARQQVCRYD